MVGDVAVISMSFLCFVYVFLRSSIDCPGRCCVVVPAFMVDISIAANKSEILCEYINPQRKV